VISSFNDKRTAAIFLGKLPKGFPTGIADASRRKLRMIDVAKSLSDLRNPPGNRLEALHGDLAGRHSIRVNDQWRVCFRWHEGNALDVEIVDYH
jgi:proteic killer suppression protein